MLRLSLRPDLAIVAVLVTAVMLMVVPLPTLAVDALLALNMAISVLVLMVAFYLHAPVQFSTLPAVILIATVFRLSLSIAVTRLVLVQADAGEIIRTFGEFVVGGNLVVGLVIFLIVTTVQFIVVTKGAERVAEVAARFTLDAMPGKQMSIDADLRSGELDQAGAKARRSALERESQLYGAMDGAMKFVKGDAIAGLIIIVVNLLGGLAVGVLQQGTSFGEAAQTYSILTVGDGLMAQIPSLFVAITAGTVVTRVGGHGDGDKGASLGDEIAGQLAADGRALWLAAGVCVLLALIPGFPVLIFLMLAAALALMARMAAQRRRHLTKPTPAAIAETQSAPMVAAPKTRLYLRLAPDLAQRLDLQRLAAALARRTATLSEELGLTVPRVEVGPAAAVPAGRFRFDLDGEPLFETSLPAASLLLRDDVENARLVADIEPVQGEDLPGLPTPPLWVPDASGPTLRAAGVGVLETDEAIAFVAEKALRLNAGQFVGIQEVRALLAGIEGEWTELSREALRVVPLPRMADLFRRLLDEGLSLRNLRGLLESIAEHGGREQEPALLAEAVRAGMRRQICRRYADPALRVIGAFLVDAEAEGLLRRSIRHASGTASTLVLPEGTATALVESIRAELAGSRHEPGPVLLTAPDIRRHLRALLVRSGVEAAVLSFQDLLPEFAVQPLGTIRLERPAAAAGSGPMAAAA